MILQIAVATLAVFMAAHAAQALEIKPTTKELKTARAWLREHLLDCKLKPAPAGPVEAGSVPVEPGLDVLANHDPVSKNGRGDKPMKIGDKEFSRGLYCHAISKVEVHLPGPGKSFTAVVGLDHNEDTARGKGSVVFTVRVKDTVAFQSEVMRYGTPGRKVSVDLGGADAFTLEVGDAGDGIGWDQSDWADAKVTLADGKETWLGEMPLRDRRPEAAPAPIQRTGALPFSFVYGGQSSDGLLGTWPKKTSSRKLDPSRTQRTLTWTDARTGLEVRCVAVEYSDFPMAEWTVYLKNTSRADTPILENIQALDAEFGRGAEGEFTLHGNKGDWCSPQSYEPYQLTLGPKSENRFAPEGGRPTNGPKGWPYFNLQRPGGGVIFAIGWPGQWACSFMRDEERSLRIIAGQQVTHLGLKPGEEIRTPLIAALFWEGADTVRAQNLWRRWMLAHNVPRLNGQLPPPMMQMQCYRTFEKGGEQDLFDTVEEFNRSGIAVELCWRDAGWYPCKGSWPNTGTWEVDPQRYPRGFRPFSDWLHQQGKKFIVWFEPERVGDRESWLAKNHPEWLLGGTLLNLGHPEAWEWLVEHLDRMLVEQGIDYYRQDFNMAPLANWRGNDAPDRRGMTEIKHVMGYLAFWDELRRRHPGLLIDSCASGGRRNDLETLRRAVPLLRSDYQFGHEATMPNQGHTYGISSWIPYYGSGCYFTDTYSARSYIMPCSGYAGTNAATKRAYEECRKVAPFMLGDYYPLTPYSIQTGDWIAWQFDRPDLGGGIVQAFRRDKNGSPTRVLRLSGLAPFARYEVTNLDGGTPERMSGRDLMERGLTVVIKDQPGSAAIFYKRAGITANALEPANPKTNAKARAILDYLQGLRARPDKRLVSGQFTGFGRGTSLRLMDNIHDRTGQWPALMGTDYADFQNGSLTSQAPNQAAIAYWKAGGLVTISAHLYNPANPKGGGLRDKGVDLETLLVPGTDTNTRWMQELDLIAAGLHGPHGSRNPPGDYDYQRFLEGVKKDFPKAVFFMSWDGKWSLARNNNVKEMLADPWIVNRSDLAAGLAGATK